MIDPRLTEEFCVQRLPTLKEKHPVMLIRQLAALLIETRAQLEQARREERESYLNTRIVDHDMLGNPITADMLHELGKPRNERGSK